MKQLIVCREYPPAPSGGIGTYAYHMSRLLAEHSETVHVIGQLWKGAEARRQESLDGRLVVHRVPFKHWKVGLGWKPHPAVRSEEARALFASSVPAQCFAWQASLLAEQLVEEEGIDVIETQDFEAPLYFFQLRRALGLGSVRRPPIIVHLHSPTEFVARYNDWDLGQPSVAEAKRSEDYSIGAADRLLCPSRYFARQAEAHYGLERGSVHVIPLPVGDTKGLTRDVTTWQNGSICFVGRLERRKGVLEWLEAAVTVAKEDPDIRFDFVGQNILGRTPMSGEGLLARAIPDEVRQCFRFHSHKNRRSLERLLAQARIAVVPSRWENFPNTCVEAMASGLPVLASPEGGMKEMVVDGRSGWLAPSARVEGLVATLRRTLSTPPSRLAEMGDEASARIRELCDNRRVADEHLKFRRRVLDEGASRSLKLPVNLPWANASLSQARIGVRAAGKFMDGIAVILTCCRSDPPPVEILSALKAQTEPSESLVVVHSGAESLEQQVQGSAGRNCKFVRCLSDNRAAMKNAGVQNLLATGVRPMGFVFVTSEDRLHPEFLRRCTFVLARCPEVGIISCWIRHTGARKALSLALCPVFPQQWVSNGTAPCSAFRTEALQEAGNFRPGLNGGLEDWDLVNAAMAAGWVGVTIPEVLAARNAQRTAFSPDHRDRAANFRLLIERHSDRFGSDAIDLITFMRSDSARSIREAAALLQSELDVAKISRRAPSASLMGLLSWPKQILTVGLSSVLSRVLAQLTGLPRHQGIRR